MLTRLKHYILIALAIGAFYFLLNHHIIVFSYKDFEVLKKSEPTLAYTFYSLKQNPPRVVLRIDPLREAGIEEIMLERGMITESKLDDLLKLIDEEKARRRQ